MPLSAGDELGHFEVLGAIGQGGMGEIYKARDTRLDRIVAIKVIHGLVASDPSMRERFEREARAVSSLNHPHICTLHDIGSHGDVDFLVMEHLEGESLADRLKKGALPFDEALRYGIEIADALDEAHRHGVVHRDLKPGNVMLTPSGAKLLDFGLAKTRAGDDVVDDSAVPTVDKPLTEKGAILGTFQYMAPEQLEGGEADSRTDIFGFGALLYEMLTGRKAFTGKSQASLITAIMSAAPQPIASLRPMTPASLDHVIGRCLEKDPETRWQTARDVKLELRWIQDHPQTPERAPVTSRTGRWRERLGWSLALAAVIAAFTLWSRARPRETSLVRTAVVLPAGLELDDRQDSHPFAVSPDGRRIAYCALGDGAPRRLFVRQLDQFEATPLAGTDNAINPAFSPDGEWIAFFADGKLKKVSIDGGAPIEIADAPFGSMGASWSDDGYIIFDQAFARGGLMRVSQDGGDAESLTNVDADDDAAAHMHPKSLPEGRGVVFDAGELAGWQSAVVKGDDDTVGDLRGLPANANLVGYVPTGHFLYSLSGSLWAVHFDLETLAAVGSPALVLDGIYSHGLLEYVAVSNAGILVYVAGEPGVHGATTLDWVNRRGEVTPITSGARGYASPRISPDGTRIAVNSADTNYTVAWIHDITRGSRFAFGGPGTSTPSWTSDGRLITYTTGEGIYQQRADRTGEPVQLLPISAGTQFEARWTADAEYLVYYLMDPSTGRDIWVLPRDGEPRELVASDASERSPRVSPNGRWLAYASNESGRDEVYVQAFPESQGKRIVSTDGGREPVWSPDGTELFYRKDDDLIAVDIEDDNELVVGTPRTLLTARFAVGSGGRNQNYDVSPDGARFVFVQRDQNVPRELRVVQNWFSELERLAPPP